MVCSGQCKYRTYRLFITILLQCQCHTDHFIIQKQLENINIMMIMINNVLSREISHSHGDEHEDDSFLGCSIV
jgi:hypothetical protein